MKQQWQPPKYWQDFEDMCWHLCKARFPHHHVQRYGRAGQKQHGVDIAISADRRDWIGVQCKLKSELLDSSLSESDLVSEHDRSRQFKPALSRLDILTTCPRNKNVQDLAARISVSFQRGHPVQVFFWDDIEDWLDEYQEVASRFYPEKFPSASSLNETADGDVNITLTPSDSHARLELLFKNAIFVAAAGRQLTNLMTLVSEMLDNFLNAGKGRATRAVITLSGPVLTIRDNGLPFDSVNTQVELAEHMRGLRAIREALESADDELIYRYEPKDPAVTQFNRTEIQIDTTEVASRDPCSGFGPTTYLLNRNVAYDFVRNLSIPADCAKYTLQLVGSEYFNASARSEFVGELVKRLAGRPLRIRVPYNAELLDTLRKEAERYPEVTIEELD